MKKALLLLALCVVAIGCNKGNTSSKGCKLEDQCGRLLDPGSNASCTEIKCVPKACEPMHETMLGHQFCDKDGASVTK